MGLKSTGLDFSTLYELPDNYLVRMNHMDSNISLEKIPTVEDLNLEILDKMLKIAAMHPKFPASNQKREVIAYLLAAKYLKNIPVSQQVDIFLSAILTHRTQGSITYPFTSPQQFNSSLITSIHQIVNCDFTILPDKFVWIFPSAQKITLCRDERKFVFSSSDSE